MLRPCETESKGAPLVFGKCRGSTETGSTSQSFSSRAWKAAAFSKSYAADASGLTSSAIWRRYSRFTPDNWASDVREHVSHPKSSAATSSTTGICGTHRSKSLSEIRQCLFSEAEALPGLALVTSLLSPDRHYRACREGLANDVAGAGPLYRLVRHYHLCANFYSCVCVR